MLAAGEATESPSRFISISDTTFDPGDLPEMTAIYGPQLPADALYDYVVASKKKEVLAPNLPLGFGVQAPNPSWGNILRTAYDSLRVAPHMVYPPCVAIFLAVLSYNLLGDALRDAIDPRLKI